MDLHIKPTWPQLEVQRLQHQDILQFPHVDLNIGNLHVNICDPHGQRSLQDLDVLQLAHVDPSLLWHRTALILRSVVEETGEDHVVVHLRSHFQILPEFVFSTFQDDKHLRNGVD